MVFQYIPGPLLAHLLEDLFRVALDRVVVLAGLNLEGNEKRIQNLEQSWVHFFIRGNGL